MCSYAINASVINALEKHPYREQICANLQKGQSDLPRESRRDLPIREYSIMSEITLNDVLVIGPINHTEGCSLRTPHLPLP